jgi:5-formyltetrahydrofolate cyclo-ligase
VVAAYVALPGEPDLAAVRAALRERGVEVLLPVARGGVLGWGRDDGRLRPGPAHPSGVRIDEPVTPAGPGALTRADVVLLPATAVDLSGARLGQGGGYYDRALADLAGAAGAAGAGAEARDVLLVAVCHDDEVLPAGAVPVAAHDRRVDAVLTPTRWVDVRPAGLSPRRASASGPARPASTVRPPRG